MKHGLSLAGLGFVAALLAGCGGSGVNAGGRDSGNPGSGGELAGRGGPDGQAGQGGSTGASQDGSDAAAEARLAMDGGGDTRRSADGACETSRLEQAVTEAFCTSGPTCRCYLTDDPQQSIGTLSLDAGGYVVDNSRLSGEEKTQWLARLGSMRWPCLADRTILYSCRFAG